MPPVCTGEHRPKGTIVSVIVIEFITLDGIVTDPDGRGGTPAGGWAFRHGPEAVVGDPFRLGSVLDEGVLLAGREGAQAVAGRGVRVPGRPRRASRSQPGG